MTTNAQHTPGKWCVGNGGYPHGAEFEIRSADEADIYITGLQWASPGDPEVGAMPTYTQAEANARLIAAAPDFAEAAPDAADILEHYAEYVRGLPSAEFERHPYIPEIEEAAAKLRAAILKATGEPK